MKSTIQQLRVESKMRLEQPNKPVKMSHTTFAATKFLSLGGQLRTFLLNYWCTTVVALNYIIVF